MSIYLWFYMHRRFLVITSILTYLSWKYTYFENAIASKSQESQVIIFALTVCSLMCT
jgi:hypothetical protein